VHFSPEVTLIQTFNISENLHFAANTTLTRKSREIRNAAENDFRDTGIKMTGEGERHS